MINASAGEECDDSGESMDCDVDCTAVMCGDGVTNVSVGEECDDGNVEVGVCDASCILAPAVVLSGNHVFDTDAGELDGVPQDHWDPGTSTWYLTGLTIEGTGQLVVSGTSALTIHVDGIVEIEGLLDVSGEDGHGPSTVMTACDTAGLGGVGGPGGFDGGHGAGMGGTGTEDGDPGHGPGVPAGGGIASTVTSPEWGGAGGGGGGHVLPGLDGASNNGAMPGSGGAAHMSLPPLIGGGGGGGGSVEKDGPLTGLDPEDDDGCGGGGGGGAVAVDATISISVDGIIDASGGAGGSEAGLGCESPGQGGGGAGGSIHLTSPATMVTGVLDVSGGPGGLGGIDPDDDLAGGDGADGHIIAP